MIRSHRLPLALTLAIAFAAGCGPVKIDVGGVVVTSSPKASKSPGDAGTPSPEGSPTPTASATTGVNATPTPGGTVEPNATPTPNQQGGGSPTPTPVGASPTPTPGVGATPTPGTGGGNASVKSFALPGPDKPMGVGVDSQGNAWVGMGNFGSTTAETDALVKLGPDGKALKNVNLPGPIMCVVVDKQDNAWALYNGKAQFGGTAGVIAKVSSDGEILSTQVLGGQLQGPGVLTLDTKGNLWTLEQQGKVDKISPNGGLLGSYPTAPISQPYGVGIGFDGSAWVGGNGTDKTLVHLGATGTVAESYKANNGSIYVVGVDSKGLVWTGGPSTGATGASTMQLINGDGSASSTFQVGAYLRSMLPDANGNMWLLMATQAGGGSVSKYGPKGETLDSFPAGDAPQNFGIGGDGSIWVTNPNSGKVTRIKPAG